MAGPLLAPDAAAVMRISAARPGCADTCVAACVTLAATAEPDRPSCHPPLADFLRAALARHPRHDAVCAAALECVTACRGRGLLPVCFSDEALERAAALPDLFASALEACLWPVSGAEARAAPKRALRRLLRPARRAKAAGAAVCACRGAVAARLLALCPLRLGLLPRGALRLVQRHAAAEPDACAAIARHYRLALMLAPSDVPALMLAARRDDTGLLLAEACALDGGGAYAGALGAACVARCPHIFLLDAPAAPRHHRDAALSALVYACSHARTRAGLPALVAAALADAITEGRHWAAAARGLAAMVAREREAAGAAVHSGARDALLGLVTGGGAPARCRATVRATLCVLYACNSETPAWCDVVAVMAADRTYDATVAVFALRCLEFTAPLQPYPEEEALLRRAVAGTVGKHAGDAAVSALAALVLSRYGTPAAAVAALRAAAVGLLAAEPRPGERPSGLHRGLFRSVTAVADHLTTVAGL